MPSIESLQAIFRKGRGQGPQYLQDMHRGTDSWQQEEQSEGVV